MTVGEVAARARVNVQTVRYSERRGLLDTPRRTAAGYRLYPEDVVARIRFIRRAQELGFTLDEILELLAFKVRHGEACHEVSQRASVKVALVERKLRELERLKRALERLVEACTHRVVPGECPILEALEEPVEHA